MKARTGLMVAVALAIAAVCVTLGFWQLERLSQRREFNAALSRRLAFPPVEIARLPTDTANARYRRVLVNGRYDYANEFVLTSRTRQGSPGVNIITPVRIAGSDTSVLVNRGWVYAPDGMTADLSKWREPDSVAGIGYVATYPVAGKGNAAASSRANAYRWLEYKVLAARTPYPLARFHVILAADSAPVPRDVPQSIPPRLPEPTFDEGPHRAYAFQWFSFAAISIIGTYLFLRRK